MSGNADAGFKPKSNGFCKDFQVHIHDSRLFSNHQRQQSLCFGHSISWFPMLEPAWILSDILVRQIHAL
jgi:hypothetical protein